MPASTETFLLRSAHSLADEGRLGRLGRALWRAGVLAVMLVGAAACATIAGLTASAPAAPDFGSVTPGAELAMSGSLTGRDGLETEVAVVVAPSRDNATIVVEGETPQTLTWNGEFANCVCRTFANDKYQLFVRFPSTRSAGEATVSRLVDDAGESLVINGVLEDDDGLDIKVVVVVGADRESVSFHEEGEPETLAWDKATLNGCDCARYANTRFEALVTWPNAKDPDGVARLKRRHKGRS
jgi:hypothetical protein